MNPAKRLTGLMLLLAALLLPGHGNADTIQRMLAGEIPLHYGNGQTAVYTPVSFSRKYKDHDIVMKGALFLPPGDQPVPVMMIAHGSSGLLDREFMYARVFLEMGVGIFVLDYYAPRGITSTISDQSQISVGAMVEDTLQSFLSIRALPRVDTAHVGLIGFSKGGAAVGNAARSSWYQNRPEYRDIHFAVHIMLYPACAVQPYPSTTTGAALYMLLGEKDTYTGVETCQYWARKFKEAGARISVKVYPGAAHAWDIEDALGWVPWGENSSRCLFEQQPDATWMEKNSGIIMQGFGGKKNRRALRACRSYGIYEKYDAVAAAQTMADVKAMVRENLLPPSP